MGHPKRCRKTYERPRKPWDEKTLREEKEIMEKYGLKNKREIYKARTIIRKYRREVREILEKIAARREESIRRKKEDIIKCLKRKGLLSQDGDLDDVLKLRTEDLLERRLQTIVYKKGLANTIKQARQLIVHGHIAIDGKKVTVPGYIVDADEEDKVGYLKEDIGKRIGVVEEIKGEVN